MTIKEGIHTHTFSFRFFSPPLNPAFTAHIAEMRPDGDADVDASRYTSAEWHEKEVERLWKRVWQFACREEEIPEPGDHMRYDIAHLSFLIVRQDDGSIKTYPNACLHRGRMLKEHDGRASELRCPFHGFAWELNGDLKDIPADWDFCHVDQDDFGLPEIPTDTWNGFVFINPDQNCGPLMEFLSDLDHQFQRWDLSKLYIFQHGAKIMPCNWKLFPWNQTVRIQNLIYPLVRCFSM